MRRRVLAAAAAARPAATGAGVGALPSHAGASGLRSLATSAKALPEAVDAVVVGGGVVGTSVAYHLQQRGLSTLVLEAHALTAGTTWHTAGMLWRLRPSYVDIELHTRTRELAIELEAEPGAAWTENGGLFIACNKERLAEYERLAQTGRYYGIDSAILSPAEAKQVHPLLNVDDIYGALHSPTDGTLDPAGLTTAYARGARALGANVVEGVRATALLTEGFAAADGGAAARVVGVRTECGQSVRAGVVVNACGSWSGELCASAGVSLPLLAMKHAYVVTESLADHGMHGALPNVRDHDLSIYLKAQGTALAIGGYEQNPEFWEAPAKDFAFGLFDLDWETFLQNMEVGCPSLRCRRARSPTEAHGGRTPTEALRSLDCAWIKSGAPQCSPPTPRACPSPHFQPPNNEHGLVGSRTDRPIDHDRRLGRATSSAARQSNPSGSRRRSVGPRRSRPTTSLSSARSRECVGCGRRAVSIRWA